MYIYICTYIYIYLYTFTFPTHDGVYSIQIFDKYIYTNVFTYTQRGLLATKHLQVKERVSVCVCVCAHVCRTHLSRVRSRSRSGLSRLRLGSLSRTRLPPLSTSRRGGAVGTRAWYSTTSIRPASFVLCIFSRASTEDEREGRRMCGRLSLWCGLFVCVTRGDDVCARLVQMRGKCHRHTSRDIHTHTANCR